MIGINDSSTAVRLSCSDAFRKQHNSEVYHVEWDIRVKNVSASSEGEGFCYISGTVSEQRVWGLVSHRYKVTATIDGASIQDRLLALRPGDHVRVAGSVHGGGEGQGFEKSFHIPDATLLP
jgi:hypothetical protein